MRKRHLLISLTVLLALWQLAATAVDAAILPGPLAVASALLRNLGRGLAGHFLISTYRVGLSMAIATLLGTPLGLAIGQNPTWNRLVSPALYLTYPLPKIVFLPVIMLFLGIGDASKVFIIAVILFFQVLVVVRDACAGVRPEMVQSVRSLGAGRLDLLRYVYFPACLPAVLTALRVSTGTAIAVLFLAESFATQAGLGYFIMVETWGRMAYADMYAGVLAMGLLGLAIYYFLDRVEQRACAWLAPAR